MGRSSQATQFDLTDLSVRLAQLTRSITSSPKRIRRAYSVVGGLRQGFMLEQAFSNSNQGHTGKKHPAISFTSRKNV